MKREQHQNNARFSADVTIFEAIFGTKITHFKGQNITSFHYYLNDKCRFELQLKCTSKRPNVFINTTKIY